MSETPGVEARRVAIDAVTRVATGGAYANIVLSPLLDRSGLDKRDRALVTEMVYGTVRGRRACDWLVDRFLFDQVDPNVRAALEVGAYQLVFMRQPAHAVVSSTVSAVPKKVRGLVNAVLRRVADDASDGPIEWPDRATQLSYPDWLVARLVDDLGEAQAYEALSVMNTAPPVSRRADGYIQDAGSQLVVEAVGAESADRVLDICAAPGGKATGMAEAGAYVVAADRRSRRAAMVARNVAELGSDASVLVADGAAGPYRPASFDKVLVDAPCSGLGTLRRRADARWRVDEATIDRLRELQLKLLTSAVGEVTSGGELIYSVCTVTVAETAAVATSLVSQTGLGASLEPLPLPDSWRQWGSGGLLLPQDHDTDGMAIFRWRVDR